MLNETATALDIKPHGTYLDATYGRGGHSQALLDCLNNTGRLVVFDRDPQAIAVARENHAGDERVEVVHTAFDQIEQAVPSNTRFDGMLFDLGVSSPQLDEAERGFSFMRDGVLDMRMDTSSGETAAEWLNRVSQEDLVKVLFELGEERFARRIARAIVESRQQEAISTTAALVKLIEHAIPYQDKHKHPATRTFQAIRLHINQESAQITQVCRKPCVYWLMAVGLPSSVFIRLKTAW